MDLEQKMQKLNEYSLKEFEAYQEGYYDGLNSGIKKGLMELREILLKNYHELPTTLGYTEQIIDFSISAVIDKYRMK